jgi:hypothetical protein
MRFPSVILAPMLGLLCGVVLLACTKAQTQPPGEVMVLVTSDMVVPNDMDTLKWSVTIGDAGAPFQSGTVDLTSSTLPATLAIVSGPETPASVTVQVEGLRAGTLRVHREAQLSNVPTEPGEVKQLVMPLNWLCTHDANPSLSCVGGQTCQAGACASDTFDVSDLLPYLAPDSGCFNVNTCFPSPVSRGGGRAKQQFLSGQSSRLHHSDRYADVFRPGRRRERCARCEYVADWQLRRLRNPKLLSDTALPRRS